MNVGFYFLHLYLCAEERKQNNGWRGSQGTGPQTSLSMQGAYKLRTE